MCVIIELSAIFGDVEASVWYGRGREASINLCFSRSEQLVAFFLLSLAIWRIWNRVWAAERIWEPVLPDAAADLLTRAAVGQLYRE